MNCVGLLETVHLNYSTNRLGLEIQSKHNNNLLDLPQCKVFSEIVNRNVENIQKFKINAFFSSYSK